MSSFVLFFFFNDTATTEIYTLSLHDALPILSGVRVEPDGGALERKAVTGLVAGGCRGADPRGAQPRQVEDRKSTRLNSSHVEISYAVFCLKKKTTTK